MGNVSFTKSSADAFEILDTNNYYPFGLNHTVGNSLNSSGFGGWQSYKYNGTELQETGMYDYGARFYMPDLGRWGVIDPLAEQMSNHSTYSYVFNNPISFTDPSGMLPKLLTAQSHDEGGGGGGGGQVGGWTNSNWVGFGNAGNYGGSYGFGDVSSPVGGSGSGVYSSGGATVYTGSAAAAAFRDLMNPSANPPSPKPNFLQRAGSFIRGIFGGNRGAGITTFLPGATVSRVGNLEIGDVVRISNFFRDQITSNASDAWNSSIARDLVNDSYSVGLTSNVAAFLGVGTTPINFTLLTRGESGIFYTPSVSVALGTGIEGNAGVVFGGARYTGNSRDINSGILQGNTFGVSAGLGAIADGSVGVTYAPTGKGHGFLGASLQLGAGIEGSPITGINIQGTYQYTPVVKPIFKF